MIDGEPSSEREAPSERSDGASSVSPAAPWIPPVERDGAPGIVRTLLEPLVRPGATVGAIGDGPVQPAIALGLAVWVAIGVANVITAAIAQDIAFGDVIAGALRLFGLHAIATLSIAVFFAMLLTIAGGTPALTHVARAAGYGQVYLLSTLPVAALVRLFEHGLAVFGLALTVSGVCACLAMLGFARRRAPLLAAVSCVAPFALATVVLGFLAVALAIQDPFPLDRP